MSSAEQRAELTLRIPGPLKEKAVRCAEKEGRSLNAWVVQLIRRSVEGYRQ